MSLNDLKKIVGQAAKSISDGEKFPVGVLAVRVRRAAEANPTDSTLVAMSNFLNKRAESNEVLISRAELRDVYNRLYSNNNKFIEIFAEEVGAKEISKRATISRDPLEGTSLIESASEKLGNPVLANALISVFDKNAPYKPYSEVIAKNAARTCLHELNKFVSPRKIDVVAGQEDIIICKATYDTPKGDSTVLVPIEIKAGTALLPNMFLSQAGFVDISKESLKDHIIMTAGKSFRVDAQKFLEVVSTAKNGIKQTLSPLEMIIAKASAAKGNTTYTENGILYQQVDQTPDLEVKVERSDESYGFEKKLASAVGAAEFMFGKSIVDIGRKMIVQAMNNFGFKHANIAVADADKSSIFFAVAVDNKAGFKVPVKVINNNPQYPSFAIASGRMVDFSSQGISSLLIGDVDAKMMAVASPLYDLKSSELLDQVKIAVAEGNLIKAEDALSILQQSGDQGCYQLAFAAYLNSINMKKEASDDTKECSMQRPVKHSKHLICGHTNLPIHKVYQDKFGQCQPLYRKDISEAEGGSFLHSKVYLG